MGGVDFALFEDAVDAVEHDAHGGRSHSFHRLADGGERRGVQSRTGHVVETDHRTMLGYTDAGPGQSADRSEGAHVIEGQQGGERALLADEFLSQLIARLEARHWIARFGEFHDKAGIELQPAFLCTLTYAPPAP